MPTTLVVKIVRLKVYTTIANPMTVTFTQGRKRDYFSNLQCIAQYQTWHTGGPMDALYAHVPFDDRDLDARSEWVGKDKKSDVRASSSEGVSSVVARASLSKLPG